MGDFFAVEEMPNLQIILGILIGLAYAIAAVVKKINMWINENRMKVNRPAPPKPRAEEDPSRQSYRQIQQQRDVQRPQSGDRARDLEPQSPKKGKAPAPQKSKDIGQMLMQELERALGNIPVEEEVEVPRNVEKAARQQEYAPPPPPMRKRKAKAKDRVRTKPEMTRRKGMHTSTRRQRSYAKTSATPRPSMSHLRTEFDDRAMNHLAVLRTPEDLRRGIVLSEILSPPRALRPTRPSRVGNAIR
ncbi:MAG: hypothetical protein ACLFQ6_06870 [Candidatus Sumerlaeia bacterium]